MPEIIILMWIKVVSTWSEKVTEVKSLLTDRPKEEGWRV